MDTQKEQKKYTQIVWEGENSHYVYMSRRTIVIQRNCVNFQISIQYIATKQIIEIQSSEPVEMVLLNDLVDELRRFEYLFNGAFHVMESCMVNSVDITNLIRKTELGYFQNAGFKYMIPLFLTDKEYKKFFLQWEKLERSLRAINQTILYGNNVRGLPVDIKLALLIECYEALAKKLEKGGYVKIAKEPDRLCKVVCPYCKQSYMKNIKGNKTLASCLLAVLKTYGKPVFSTEYRRKNSMVRCFVNIRVKVFHVKSKKENCRNRKKRKFLSGPQCRFYAIKFDWLYRYIIWILLGIDQSKLDQAIEPQIAALEKEYPWLLYMS